MVFLTDENIELVLRESSPWLHSSWVLANLYLGSIGAELLAEDAPRIVGLSEETTCYVSTEYFVDVRAAARPTANARRRFSTHITRPRWRHARCAARIR